MRLSDSDFQQLLDVRVHQPASIAEAYASRPRRTEIAPDGALFIIAADHTARGALAVGQNPLAMADRRDLIERLATALENPRVDGVLASADIMDDLMVLGLLDGRVAIGTMNRGGLMGAKWEIDDRMTAFDVEHIVRSGLDAGKVLLRMDDDDAGTTSTLESCGQTVTNLADHQRLVMIEPIAYTKNDAGLAIQDARPEKVIRAAAVASGLGSTSAYTWLKIRADVAAWESMSVTTCPSLLLGGALSDDPGATYASWEKSLTHPNCRGLVVGRSMLYPHDGDVAAAVDVTARLVATQSIGRRSS